MNLSNGITWNADATKLYYIDTGVFSVDAFDYDEATNSISENLATLTLWIVSRYSNDIVHEGIILIMIIRFDYIYI